MFGIVLHCLLSKAQFYFHKFSYVLKMRFELHLIK